MRALTIAQQPTTTADSVAKRDIFERVCRAADRAAAKSQ